MNSSNFYILSPEQVVRPSQATLEESQRVRKGTILDQTFEDLVNDPFLYAEDTHDPSSRKSKHFSINRQDNLLKKESDQSKRRSKAIGSMGRENNLATNKGEITSYFE